MKQRFTNYLESLKEAYCGAHERVIDVENQLFHTNHAVIGYYVARSWNLPKTICDAIANHHNIIDVFANESTVDAPQKTLLSILKIAEHLCGHGKSLGQTQTDIEWERIQYLIYEYTGLGPYELEVMIDQFTEMGIMSVISNRG